MATFNKILIDNNGIKAVDTSVIRDKVASDWVSAFSDLGVLNTDSATPQGNLIDSQTLMVSDNANLLLTIMQQFDLRTSSGIWLDALAGLIPNVKRFPATSTFVNCEVRGLSGTMIPVGALVSDGTNDYECVSSITIGVSGIATASFKNKKTGAIPCPINSVNKIITIISGWDSVDNPVVGIIGSPEESDYAFKERLKRSLEINSQTLDGSVQSNVSNVDGVLDVLVRSNKSSESIILDGVSFDPNSTCVSVIGGDNNEIAQTMLNSWGYAGQIGNQNGTALDPTTGQSYVFKILRPDEVKFFIKIQINTEGVISTDIINKIKDLIFDNFYGLDQTSDRIRINSTTFSSRFFLPLSTLQGLNIISIQLATQRNGDPISAYGNIVSIFLNEYPSLIKNDINVEVIE